MSFKSIAFATLTTLATALPAMAADIMVDDAYARSSAMSAKTGAAFMMIHNQGDTDDRLIGVSSPAAKVVQLHTHKEDANGVMKMMHVEEGFALPAEGMIKMQRGGHHVMFMGISEPFEQGIMIPLTLTFEKAGEIEVEVPVDLERQPMQGGGHGKMSE
ncbi:copper chaperone PCu(A)C [Roseovarius sp. A21]|uniref:Copper chaperone PCu(A)C n=1 Tax=Roseovarius bejariae TaxID=2576383 RepID=A0A844D4S1_9RHOB|nr:copper chaperone PCu(A)C [Roseovarius bejariae]MRU16278.1 copper chaperone PCu(A)C [Roseovarius bejariae]